MQVARAHFLREGLLVFLLLLFREVQRVRGLRIRSLALRLVEPRVPSGPRGLARSRNLRGTSGRRFNAVLTRVQMRTFLEVSHYMYTPYGVQICHPQDAMHSQRVHIDSSQRSKKHCSSLYSTL